MNASTALLLGSIMIMLTPAASAHADDMPRPNEEYARYVYTDSLNHSMPYRMLTPDELAPAQKYPLVVFLHGSGERGIDNEKQLAHGASLFSNPANVDKFPAYVVFPQCNEKSWTGTALNARSFMPGAPTPAPTATEQMVMGLIHELVAHNPIDTDRIYLVGLSMGGVATYDLACRYPDTFAAAVPICGAVNPERLAPARHISFLIFHGEDDDRIPNLCSREAYKALNAAGATVDYVEFAGTGHECWSQAFNYPTLLPWLFSQSKSTHSPSIAQISF